MNDMPDLKDADIENPNGVPEVHEDTYGPMPPPPPKSKLKPAIAIAAIFLLGLSVGVGAMFLDARKATESTDNNLRKTDDAKTEAAKLPGVKDEDTEISTDAKVKDGWLSYKDPVSNYSFHYPASWSLTRDVVRHPYVQKDTTEYEKITLKSGDKEVVVLDYPFEMTGCGPSTSTEPYDFGKYSAKMTDPCGGVPSMAGRQYMILFDNPRTRPSNLTEKEWPMLRLSLFPAADTGKDFVDFAKSFEGLVPVQKSDN